MPWLLHRCHGFDSQARAALEHWWHYSHKCVGLVSLVKKQGPIWNKRWLSLTFCHEMRTSWSVTSHYCRSFLCTIRLNLKCIHETPIILYCNRSAFAHLMTESKAQPTFVSDRSLLLHKCPNSSLWLQNRHRFLQSSGADKDHTCNLNFHNELVINTNTEVSLLRSELRTLSETFMWWVVWNMDFMK